MKPTHTLHRPDPPPATINQIINDLIGLGVDRGALVRRKTAPGKGTAGHAGVAIFLLSEKAVRDVGPFLLAHAAKLPETTARILVDGNSRVPLILAALDDHSTQWTYCKIFKGALFCVVGPSVTETFAAELTSLGVTTNLT